MKKTFIILGTVAMMATFNSCGDCETTEGNDAVTNDTTETTDGAEVKDDASNNEVADVDAKEDKFAMIDTDGNGSISKDEFNVFVDAETAKIDANADGVISKDECEHFDDLNTDGDDVISTEELKAGHEEMYIKIDVDENGEISKEEMEAHMASEKEDVE